MTKWASHFYEIPDALENNEIVRDRSLALIESEPIHAKAVEGGDRSSTFRDILRDFFVGDAGFDDARTRVSAELPSHQSPCAHDTSNTFNRQWEDRLVRSEGSRFYNHAVLLTLNERGDEACFVPESPHQDPGKKCTQLLAGREASVEEMLSGLERAFRNEEWGIFPRIPFRPNCTHTITPVE